MLLTDGGGDVNQLMNLQLTTGQRRLIRLPVRTDRSKYRIDVSLTRAPLHRTSFQTRSYYISFKVTGRGRGLSRL